MLPSIHAPSPSEKDSKSSRKRVPHGSKPPAMAFPVTIPHIRKDVSDPLAYQPLPRLLDQLFQAPVDIDDPQFGIDRVERVADAIEDLFNASAQLLGELLALAQDLAFEAALLGDVATFADKKPDVSVPVFDW